MLRLLHKFLTVFYLFQFIFIGVCLIYNAVLVSGVQQSDSVIHITEYILYIHITEYMYIQLYI